MSSSSCGRQHTFIPGSRDDADYECDHCGKAFTDPPAVTCSRCDFDLCQACYDVHQTKKKKENAAADNNKSAAVEASDGSVTAPPLGPAPPTPSIVPRMIISAHGDTNFDSSSRCIRLDRRTFSRDNSMGGGSDVVKDSEHDALFFAHADNFAGVKILMDTYWSGMLPPSVNCQVTCGEEGEIEGVEFWGARKVAQTIRHAHDLVVVLDVTAIPLSKERRSEAVQLYHCSPLASSIPHQRDDARLSEALQPRDAWAPSRAYRYYPTGFFTVEKVRNNSALTSLLLQAWGPPDSIDFVEVPRSKEDNLQKQFHYALFNDCPDPQCNQDESDVYQHFSDLVFFLGVPTYGGRWTVLEGEAPADLLLGLSREGDTDPQIQWRDVECPSGQNKDTKHSQEDPVSEGASSRSHRIVSLCSSGDYNAEKVFCWEADFRAVKLALVKLAKVFETFKVQHKRETDPPVKLQK